MPRIDDIRLRRDSLANWNAADPVLNDGEVGLITDQRNLRVGDGVTAFTGLVDWITGGGAWKVAVIEDRKTAGTNGGDFASGAWRTRDLNNIAHDDIGGLSVSANAVSGLAGKTVFFIIRSVAYLVRRHKIRLWDSVGGELLVGSSELALDTDGGHNSSMIFGVATPAGDLSIEHKCETTRLVNGFGVQSGFAVEIYTRFIAIEV